MSSSSPAPSDHNAAIRSDINHLISKKVRRAQLEDDPITLQPHHLHHHQHAPFVLRPDRKFRRYWDIYIFILLAYVATVSFFIFSFLGTLDLSSPWFWVERFIDVSFFIDIILNFFTAYEHIGVLITHPVAIRRHYASTWFIPDLLSTFPWDALALAINTDDADTSKPSLLHLPRFLRIVRLFKLIRLTRILRLRQGFTKLEVKLRLKYGYVRLAGLLCTVLFAAHWFACLFFYFGSLGDSDATWMTQDGVPTDLYGQYIFALYFSVYTITTIGYGDVVPENTLNRTYTTVIMLCGAAMFAYIISTGSNIASELNASSAYRHRLMDSLTDFAKYRNLPDDLAYDIRRFFQREHLRQRVADEKQLLGSINKDLRIKVLKHMYGTHLEHSRLLRDIPSSRLDDVYNSVSERFARKDERLYSEGDEANCFYILLSGDVHLQEAGVPTVSLDKDGIFGDEDLLFNRPRSSTAICASYCDLLVVPREEVINTLLRHPSQWKSLRDEEALLLWDKVINTMEQQIRYTKIASTLRHRGENHMRGKNLDADQDGGTSSSQEQQEQQQQSIQGLLARTRSEDYTSRHTRYPSWSDQGTTADGRTETGSHITSHAEESTVAAIERLLKEKTDRVNDLESKLQDLQKQLEMILGGVRQS